MLGSKKDRWWWQSPAAIIGAARAPGTKSFQFVPERVIYRHLKNSNKDKKMGLGTNSPATNYGESSAECRRNYQKEAAVVKQKIDANAALLKALSDYSKSPGASYDVKNDTFNLNELFGYLSMKNIEHSTVYEHLLEEVEKEKADGSK